MLTSVFPDEFQQLKREFLEFKKASMAMQETIDKIEPVQFDLEVSHISISQLVYIQDDLVKVISS